MKLIKEYVKDANIFEEQEYEFKIELGREKPEHWVKTIVAYANENGGKMFVGVTNDGFAKGITQDKVDDEQKYFVDFIKQKVKPNIHYDVSYIPTEEGNIVICIDVPEHEGSVVSYKEKPDARERVYRRYPGSTYELKEIVDIAELSNNKRNTSIDTIATKYNANEFTFNSLNEKYKERVGTNIDLTEKQLKSVGLITDDNKLTVAGMYFVDKCPEEFPAIHLRKWPGFNKGSDYIIDAKELNVNLIEQLNEAEKFIRNNTKTGMMKAPGGASDVLSYPSIAITEALCNAIGHRDYLETYSNQIDVDIYQDRIEIVSPGKFLPKGRAQDYEMINQIPSKRRNKAISDTLAMCKLMQRYGSGFDKIVEAYEPFGEEYQPKVFSNDSWFTITLMDVTFKKTVDATTGISLHLKGNQKNVYETIKLNPGLRTPDIAQITNLSLGSAERAIKELRKKEFIVFNGDSPKTGGYFIVTK